MTAQQQINFSTPIKPISKRIRPATIERYDRALDYLRNELLSLNKYVMVHPHEIAKQFSISGGFMHLVTKLGAVDKQDQPGGHGYKALPYLWTINGEDVLRLNHELRDIKKLGEQMAGPAEVTVNLYDEPLKVMPSESTVYMVGVTKGDLIEFHSSKKVYSLEEAKEQLFWVYVPATEKIVIAQVIEVVTPVRSFQPATL